MQEHLVEAERKLTNLQDTTQITKQSLNNSESTATQEFRDTRQTNQSVVPVSKLQTAKDKEKEGFQNLISGDYENAIAAFQESENVYNGYHNVYDIKQLLRQNKSKMNDPAKKKEIFQKIVKDYSYGAPPDLLEQVKIIANQ